MITANQISDLGKLNYTKNTAAAYKPAYNDNVIGNDATNAAITVTLPDATAHAQRIFDIKKLDSSANTVTVATTASQTIDGNSTVVITGQYGWVRLQSDGKNWNILSYNFAGASLAAPIVNQALASISTQNATLSAAQLLGGVIEHAVATGAGADTTDTAANIDAAITNPVNGMTFNCLLVNTSASAYAITLSGGTGVTLKGSATTVGQNKTALLTFRRTGAGAWTCYVTVSA